MKYPILAFCISALLTSAAFAAEAPKSSAATAPTTPAGTAPAAPAEVKAADPGTQPRKKKKLMEKAEEAFSDFGDKVAGVLKADPKDKNKPAPEQDKAADCAADANAPGCGKK